MQHALDATHDPSARSWVASAQAADADFPLQNLPFGRFRTAGQEWRLGVAIGDQVLDLPAARASGLPLDATLEHDTLNAFMALGRATRQRVRHLLFDALQAGSPLEASLRHCLVPQSACDMGVPCRVGDYSDFYSGIHHATTVGRMFRPEAPLLPNYKWVPIAYHGRASSIVVSGTAVARPAGQLKPEGLPPHFAPTQRLDFELELGVLVGRGNTPGHGFSMDEADADWFGMVLLNDWSARDLQAWEYQPLGPFLAKSFATTVSPWVVTQEALAPFRTRFVRPAGDPDPLPHLDSDRNRRQGAIDIVLEVLLQTPSMPGRERISHSNFRDAYWTVAQMLAHHASNGCNLQPGDLLGSGTQSGPLPDQGGSLLELAQGGRAPLRLAGGEERAFLHDGDRVTLRAHCRREGAARIGFGDCTGQIAPWPGPP